MSAVVTLPFGAGASRVWYIGLAASLVLHGAALLGWPTATPSRPVLSAVERPTRTPLSLGMAAALRGARLTSAPAAPSAPVVTPHQAITSAATPQTKPVRVAPKTDVAPKPKARRRAAAEPSTSVKAPARRAKATAPMAKDLTPRAQSKSATRSAETAVQPAQKAPGTPQAQGARQHSAAKVETGQANREASAPSAAFDRAVRAHLLARKRSARLLGQTRAAAVVVEFDIDRQGNLMRQYVGQPSRIRALDTAARQLVASAAPYPKAPASSTWPTRRYRIRLEYAGR
ncbi:MAG: TonB family protein [Aeromonas sp.]